MYTLFRAYLCTCVSELNVQIHGSVCVCVCVCVVCALKRQRERENSLDCSPISLPPEAIVLCIYPAKCFEMECAVETMNIIIDHTRS